MPKTRAITRRTFLKKAAGSAGAAAAFTIVPRHVLGGPGYTPPSEVITRAVIGVGGMGLAGHVTTNEEGKPPVTLAVCDVDRDHLAAAMKKAARSCEAYTDWRRVLERTDVDTIHIATPPHWHALMGIAAAQAGFDIMAEKPFTRTVREGQAYVAAVQRYGRILQVNTHFRFESYYQFGASRVLKRLVDSGLLGRPLTVRVFRSLGFDWKIKLWSGRTNLKPQAMPSELDYDMWLGPAPVKPYHPHRVHQSFRGYWDYDGGGLADMGQHYLDPIQYILGKDDTGPIEISAEAPWPPHPDAVQLWGSVRLRYADGDTLLLESGEWGPSSPAGLPFIEGPNGRVFDNYRTDPPGLFDQLAGLPEPPPLVDFETAVRTRQKAGGNESVAHRSCSLVNLANIAIRTGRPLRWNPQAQVFINDDGADALLEAPMRAPWRLSY
ncbi:MAG: Gfo/Idh/MocA family oxidoreductase [Phycisphaerae bacterium]|jgi:predicted dehydrogenase|nr:Gfo/Idh/MocA family oxidoreductase [Phycisphaerae bacterium]MCZ2398901.1 Gfo/Idh/MocA family oxidoreductase [Phycisphaerae bacterium]NUQ50069.1 Gfo/Idh/MocA family oxidoreductase [Phycisphaerae bacterium]